MSNTIFNTIPQQMAHLFIYGGSTILLLAAAALLAYGLFDLLRRD